VIAVSYHDDLKEVQADPQLAALLSVPQARAPFDRIDWWVGLERDCGLVPMIAVAADGDYRAVLPLHRAGTSLESLANYYAFRTVPLASPQADAKPLFKAIEGVRHPG
jgi:hypothetical protein